MQLIKFLLSHSRGLVTLGALAGLISGASNAGLLALIQALIVGSEQPRSLLLWLFVGLCILVPATRVCSELLLIRLGQETVFKLRVELSRRVLDVPLRRLEELGAPRILSTLTEDVPTITGAVSVIPLLCINSAIVVCCLIYLGWLSLPLLGGLLLLILIGVLGYQLPVARAMRYMHQARRLNDELYTGFRSLTEGAKELKLHRGRRETFLSRELEATSRDFRDKNVSGLRIYAIASSWGQVLVFVVIGLLLFAVPTWSTLDLNLLLGYTLVLLYLMTPLQVLMNTLPIIGRAGVAVARIDRLGLELAQGNSSERVDDRDVGWGTLELRQVTFTYRRADDSEDFVLGPIDLTIRPGEILFIAGGNGSGKTTLIKLLTGLYEPAGGEIRLDGQPITGSHREAFRQLFSVVFFDFHLFPVSFGEETAELDARARKLLHLLHLESKVQIENGHFSTTELSQGQRKRLALLTAVLEDRPIYVFDEWAADQDPTFKAIFYHQILQQLQAAGKAIVVISHDDRYFDVGDRFVKLEDGKIVTQPTGPTVTSPMRSS
ncbi:MAG: cyclic peptide export ABC transporter [Acidobacteriota bacterium]